MTKASEVTVSDEQVLKHIARMHGSSFYPSRTYIEVARQAMQDLIAARVPDAWDENDWECAETHNALRDAVLRGPG